jgi:Cu+-exporting ATPase
MAASIQVEGMTCAACAGTVERALTAAMGVQKASVSCVTGLARVEFDASLCSGKLLCRVIESDGFGAKVQAEDEIEKMSSKATLHVESNCPREKLEEFARQLDGVLSCRTLAKGHQRIDYDPYVVGARVLLTRLKDAVGPCFEVRPTDEGSADEHLVGYEEHIRSLMRDVKWATPPALIVFFLEIVIPAAKLDGDITPLEFEVLQGHIPLRLLLLVLCATIVIVGPGMRFHKAAIGAIKRRFPNMDVLVSVAAGTAYLYSLVIVCVCVSTPSDSPTVHELKHASGHFLAMGPILIAVVIFGKILESTAKLKAMKALVDIPSSLPPTAVICEEKGDQTIPMELVELGDVVRIFAGGRVPVDGSLCSDAEVHVDESMLTGESRPVSKKNGDALLAGTLCVSGGCLIRVSKVGGDTTLGQMMKLVQDAQASKAGMQRVADSIARVFVPTVFVIAILTFFVWTTLVFTGVQELPSMSNEENSGTDHAGMSGMDNSGMDNSGTNEEDHGTGFLKVLFSMNFSISVLMIACPCAMGLAVPMAVMVAVGIAAKRGCLVKNAEALEVAARLDALVLDKTGTITEGAPRVTHAAYCPEVFAPMQSAWASMQSSVAFEPLNTVKTIATVESKQTAGSAFGDRFSARSSVGSRRELAKLTVETIGEAKSGSDTKAMKDCFWWIMGSLESTSDHPIAKCVQGAVQNMAHLPPASGSQDFEVIQSRGVRCTMNELGGVTARVGNLSYYQETSSEPPSDAGAALIQWMKDMQQKGHIVVLMHINGMPAGAVALRDPIRKESPAVIDYVQRKLGATVYMCTGDNAATAQAIAQEVGIEHVIAEAMPATKSELVARLQKPATPGGRPLRVCFCGDGMNDSPALAQADVGVAIGVGADVAVEAADVALVRDEIDELAAFLALGRATFKTILVNFFWAFCFNIVCLPLAAGIFYPTAHIPPLVAGIGMSCSSLFVVWWSLLLKVFFKAPFASRHDEERNLAPDLNGPMAPVDPAPAADGQGKPEQRTVTASIRVEGMTCAACAGSVERALIAAKGVQKASVSCVTGLARVEFDANLCSGTTLCDVIHSVGFGAEVDCTDEDKKRIMVASIQVDGMTCAACAGSVEGALTAAKGVQKASVSCVTGLARVEFDAKFSSGKALCELVESVGFCAKVEAEDEIDKMSSKAALHVESSCPRDKLEGLARQLDGVLSCRTLAKGHQRIDYDPYVVGARVLLARLRDAVGPDFELSPTDEGSSDEHLMGYEEHIRGLARDAKWAAPPALLVFILEIAIPAAQLDGDITPLEFEVLRGHIPLRLLLLVLSATIVIVGPGMRFHKAAIGAIKRRFPNMDVLVSVAAGLAYLYSLVIVCVCVSTPSDSPTVYELKHASGHFLAMGPILIAVVIFGKIIESKAKLKAMKALVDIPSSLPPTAVICEEKGDQTIPMELVQLGDVVRVFAGGRVPVDGSLCSDAEVHVDESMLTGESRPVSKKNGDALLAGTLCVTGGCLIRVTKVGGDTTLGQMMKLVQDAQASKAGMQRVADSLARVFVPTVFVIAILTFCVWTTLVFTGVQELPNMSNEAGTDNSGHSGHSGMDNSGMDNSASNEDDHGTGFLKVLFSMNFSISVLMIACPCAMGLAVPMAVMVAVGLAAKRGCLVKNAEALEVAARLDALVLDKTGTITEGAPRVTHAAYCPEVFAPMKKAWALMNSTQQNAWASVGSDAVAFQPLDTINTIKTLESKQSAGSAFGDRFSARSSVGSKRERAVPTVETIGDAKTIGETIGDSKAMKDCFWWIMGSLESTSDHPIAKCVQGTVQKIGHLPPASGSQDFEVTQSRGVRCTLHELGGVTARVGNLSYYQETSSKPLSDAGAALIQWMKDMQQKGHIVVLMHIDGMPAGAVALRDPIREESPWVIDYVQKKLGAKVYMCTGDNAATAQAIAREVGIEHVIAEAMPATKSELVARLQKPAKPGGRPLRVCFCGDGMNDSPALAQADVGVAIGVGADVAVEAADVALVRDEIDELVAFMALSRATFKTILVNFFWAFCFNIVCLPLAAGVFYPTAHIPPLVAGIGMSCSSVFVVLQSLLLRFFKAPHASHPSAVDASRRVPPAPVNLDHREASDGRGASEPIVIDS